MYILSRASLFQLHVQIYTFPKIILRTLIVKTFFFVVAVYKPVTMSSVFRFPKINAVNNITICPNVTYTAHSVQEHMPWIKIDLQSEYDVRRIAIFNLQDHSGRFVHVR